MKKNGIQLGEMNMLLLKKIEELTLHTIEMNKGMKELKEENDSVKQQLRKLQTEIKELKK